jgi:hypothetical protein
MHSPFAPALDPRDFASEGATTFEITTDFSQREFHYEHDSHLNARGHEVLARELGALVAERIRAQREPLGAAPPPPSSRPGPRS